MVEDKKNEVAKRDLKSELHTLKTQEAKWTRTKSVFDHLAPHERPFNIEPFPHDRQRLPFKMTDEDRLRRKKWLESQTLTDREPVRVEEINKHIRNPIRRLYSMPMNFAFKLLAPVFVRIILIKILKYNNKYIYFFLIKKGNTEALALSRWLVPKVLFCYFMGVVGWYQIKYNRPVIISI